MTYRKIRASLIGAAVFASALWITNAPLQAQTLTTGDIAGTVKDASGGVIPNATVSIQSVESSENRKATTNGQGQYRFSLLAPGAYTITGSATGLKPTIEKINVLIGQSIEVNLGLTVEGSKAVIEVSAETSLLQTEDANLSRSFSTKEIQDLPMPGGDLTTLGMTTPGVRVNVKGGSGSFNANGVPGASVMYTLNGADIMDPYNNLNNSGASNNTLGANEVSEAAVILNAFDAQYGRQAGGQENIIGKSGSNNFHGSATYDFNYQGLNARDLFATIAGNKITRSDSTQYAGLVSGPIKKNKVYFLFDTEGLRYVLPAVSTVTMPSTQLLNYALAHVPASALPLYQDAAKLYENAPGISRAVPVTNGSGPTQDSKGNLGCQTIGTFKGTPDGQGGIFGVTTPCSVVFVTSNNQLNTESLYTGRVDYNINDKQKIYFRFNYDVGNQATSTSPINPVFNSVSHQPQYSGQINYTYVITPTLVNNFIAATSYYSAIFGIASESAALALMPERFAFTDGGSNSSSSTAAYSPVGTASVPNGRNVGQLQLIDDLSWTRGRHTIKGGVNYRYNPITATNLEANSTAGIYTFKDLTDFANGVLNSTGKGSTFTQSFPLLLAAHIRAYSLNVYAQDEWALKSNLKVTFGIRLERDGNPACLDNCFSRLNVPFGSSGYQGGLSVPYNSTIMTGLHNAYSGLESIIPEPRFSVAYSPFGSGKTVIRGGVGLFANLFADSVANSVDVNAPNVFSPTVTTGNVGSLSDPASAISFAYGSAAAFQSGFSKGYTLAQLQAALPTGVTFAKPGFYSTPANFAAPKILEWNIQIEQPVWGKDVLSITYTGNHGYDESLSNTDANAFIATNSIYAKTGYAGLPFAAPDPRFLAVTQVLTSGISNYNAGIIQLRHAFAHGLQGQFGYTLSHALGDVGVYNPYNINSGYGPLSFDTRHAFTADFVYTTPKVSNHMLNAFVANWTLSGKFYVYSGSPFAVTNSAIAAQINSAGGVGNTILADVLNPQILGVNCPKNITGSTPCLTAASFATSATQTDFGNTAPNMFRGAGYTDIDAHLEKAFVFKEKYKLGLGAQAYNLLNHPNLANASGSVTSSGLGFISATVSPPTSIYGSGQAGTVSGRVLVIGGRMTF